MSQPETSETGGPTDNVTLFGISRSDLTSFIRNYYPDGRPGGDVFQRPLALGDIDNSQGDRELYGPMFVDYAVSKAINMAPFEDAPRIFGTGELTKGALQKLLEGRRSQEGRVALKKELPVLIGSAAVRQNDDPLYTAAFATRELLRGDTAETLAEDVVAALGYIARKGLTVEGLPERESSVNPFPDTPEDTHDAERLSG